MKDLVQELREAAGEISGSCSMFARIAGIKANCGSTMCSTCLESTLNALADRIEREYDPKPEPDTVEKVAREMLDYMEKLEAAAVAPLDKVVRNCRDRLEALGVKFDD